MGFLIVVNLLVFVLAFFLDFFDGFTIVLLGLVADKLGIDLICSESCSRSTCRHPSCTRPLASRSSTSAGAARARPFLDKMTGRTMEPGATTGQIYWGAIYFLRGAASCHGRPGDCVPPDGPGLSGRRATVDPARWRSCCPQSKRHPRPWRTTLARPSAARTARVSATPGRRLRPAAEACCQARRQARRPATSQTVRNQSCPAARANQVCHQCPHRVRIAPPEH